MSRRPPTKSEAFNSNNNRPSNRPREPQWSNPSSNIHNEPSNQNPSQNQTSTNKGPFSQNQPSKQPFNQQQQSSSYNTPQQTKNENMTQKEQDTKKNTQQQEEHKTSQKHSKFFLFYFFLFKNYLLVIIKLIQDKSQDLIPMTKSTQMIIKNQFMKLILDYKHHMLPLSIQLKKQ